MVYAFYFIIMVSFILILDIVATSLSGSDKPFGGCEAYLTKDPFAVYLKTEIKSVQHFPAGVEAYAVNKVKEGMLNIV